MKPVFDCKNCGACCVGNIDYGYLVDLEPEDIKKLTPYYRRKHVVYPSPILIACGSDGNAALATRIGREGNFPCVAFRGRVGGSCYCAIYKDRPKVCKDFPMGSEYCLEARKQEGLES